MAKLLPPHGLLPEKGHSNCFLCKKEFGLINREYTCKRCFRPVCEACSPDSFVTVTTAG